jgi:hypothetical protein
LPQLPLFAALGWAIYEVFMPSQLDLQILELWKMPGGSKSYRARTLGYSPGLELELNICSSEGTALAA